MQAAHARSLAPLQAMLGVESLRFRVYLDSDVVPSVYQLLVPPTHPIKKNKGAAIAGTVKVWVFEVEGLFLFDSLG